MWPFLKSDLKEEVKEAAHEGTKEALVSFRDEIVNAIKEGIREGMGELSDKIDTLGNTLGNEINSLGKTLDSKMNILIHQVRSVRAEMSEITLLKLFVEELRERGYKVKADPSGVLHDEEIDFVIKAERRGKEVLLYTEVKTAVVSGMVEKIKRKFEKVKGENVEKWLLARFVDSAALEELSGTDINIYALRLRRGEDGSTQGRRAKRGRGQGEGR